MLAKQRRRELLKLAADGRSAFGRSRPIAAICNQGLADVESALDGVRSITISPGGSNFQPFAVFSIMLVSTFPPGALRNVCRKWSRSASEEVIAISRTIVPSAWAVTVPFSWAPLPG